MRILYINHPGTDYLQDLLYAGLHRLGLPPTVVESPWNQRYHLRFKPYPKNIGANAQGLLVSLLRSRRISGIDAVVVAACKPLCFERYLELAPKIPRSCKTVFIDGGDYPDIGGDLARTGHEDLYRESQESRPFDLIFKREYSNDAQHGDNVSPLPLAIEENIIRDGAGPKKYDLAFWAVESHPDRTKVFDLLQGQFDCDDNGTRHGQSFGTYARRGADYLRELSQCSIAINVRGGGWDTLRYWEIPAIGTFMASQEPGIRIPNMFRHGEHCHYFQPDFGDLVDACAFYLKNPDVRERIARQGALFARQYHTSRHRAQQFMDRLNASDALRT